MREVQLCVQITQPISDIYEFKLKNSYKLYKFRLLLYQNNSWSSQKHHLEARLILFTCLRNTSATCVAMMQRMRTNTLKVHTIDNCHLDCEAYCYGKSNCLKRKLSVIVDLINFTSLFFQLHLILFYLLNLILF